MKPKIDVIIPTMDRWVHIQKTIESLKKQTYDNLTINIMVDGNHGLAKKIAQIEGINIIFNEKRIDWPRCIVKALKMLDPESALYASDDLIFRPNCLAQAVRCINQHFPDGDGLIGINQENIRHGCPAAFALFGKKFIERFPNKQIFFPVYKHFSADAELWSYAKTNQIFRKCIKAKVYHHRLEDHTRRVGRKDKSHDHRIRKWRKKRDLFWGNNFKIEGPGL